MALTMDALVQKFHNLTGITLSERQKSFNQYLADIKAMDDDKKQLVKLLKPVNRLEEVFYTTILLEFQENEVLLNILYSNDIQLRKKVLRSDVFIKDMYEIIVVDDFSLDVSFVVRLRILLRLGEVLQDDDRLDGYYQMVRRKYGVHLAKNLLPGCTLETITEEMKKNRVLFNNKQLTKIYKRFPDDFLEYYFNHLKENNFKTFSAFDKLIRHVALTKVDVYWKLLNKFQLNTKISQRSTIKLLIKHQNEILQNGEKYINVLHKNAAFKFFTIDKFKTLYSKLLPKYLIDLTKENFFFSGSDQDIVKCLNKRVPNNLRFDILNDVFKQRYNSTILDHDDLFTEELLEIVPTHLRDDIIAKKIEKDKSDDWLCFHELEKAQTILRQRISITADPNKRRQQIFLLVKACKVNRNPRRLVEVVQFINARHRNEDAALFRCIFKYLINFDLKKFEAEHWEGIFKMIRIYFITTYNEFHYSDSMLNIYFEGYLDFRLRQNLPIEEEVLKYLKLYFRDYHLMLFRSRMDKEKHKMVLNMCAEMIPKTFTDNELLRHACSFYLQSIVDYNKENPTDFQDLTQREFMIKYINDAMDDELDEGLFKSYIFIGLKNLARNKVVYKKVADALWSLPAECQDLQWIYFLRNDPQYCVKYHKKFFDHTWDNKQTKNYEHLVQYYTHLGLPQQYDKTSKDYLTNPAVLIGHAYNYEVALRFLVYSEDFVEVTKRFLPPTEEWDFNNTVDNDDINLLTIKKTLGAMFGKCKNLDMVLQPLIVMSKSDYLRYTLQSIYKIAYNMPEGKLQTFLQDFCISSTGLNSGARKKHAFCIATAIADQQKVYQTLKTVGKAEELYSVRKCLFNSSLNYFFLNPSDEMFELVKQHCWLINFQDPEGYDMCLKFDKIPVAYLFKYVEFIWEFTQGNDHEDVRNLKYKIFEKLDGSLMKHFKQDFLDAVVKECVNFELGEVGKIYQVLYRYIIQSGELEKLNERLKIITTQFRKDIFDCHTQTSQNLLNFTIGFCENILKEKRNLNYDPEIILKTYKQSWEQVCSIENNFEEYIYLKLTEYSCQNDIKYQLLKNVNILLGEIIKAFGTYIVPNFARIFVKFFSNLMRIEELQSEEELFKFLLEMLKKPEEENLPLQRTNVEYFVLLCLPRIFPKATNARLDHSQILDILKKTKAKSVGINLSCYINSIEELVGGVIEQKC